MSTCIPYIFHHILFCWKISTNFSFCMFYFSHSCSHSSLGMFPGHGFRGPGVHLTGAILCRASGQTIMSKAGITGWTNKWEESQTCRFTNWLLLCTRRHRPWTCRWGSCQSRSWLNTRRRWPSNSRDGCLNTGRNSTRRQEQQRASFVLVLPVMAWPPSLSNQLLLRLLHLLPPHLHPRKGSNNNQKTKKKNSRKFQEQVSFFKLL